MEKAVTNCCLAPLLLCATLCGCAKDTVVVHYRVIGQCDSMGAFLINGQEPPGPDVPGWAYLFIQVFAIENNSPDAVDFALTDSKMFVVQSDSHWDFSLDWLVRSPSPYIVPAHTVQTGLYLLYDAHLNGLDYNNPAQDAATVDWSVGYDSSGGPGVIMVKEPPGAGGQVQSECKRLQFHR
jgi:hypothetical protein